MFTRLWLWLVTYFADKRRIAIAIIAAAKIACQALGWQFSDELWNQIATYGSDAVIAILAIVSKIAEMRRLSTNAKA